ncbi:hypothetical protein [Sorangium sp. So ce693]|uniref:hypothetical protein n=1 Tax=Sorangium sp. So ce693 TaxID=3133318 RepID=UPI003F5F470D
MLDDAIARWAEWQSGQDEQGKTLPLREVVDINFNKQARAAMEGVALAIVAQAAIVAQRLVNSEVERALAPKPSRVRAVCGRVLRGLAHLVDPSS